MASYSWVPLKKDILKLSAFQSNIKSICFYNFDVEKFGKVDISMHKSCTQCWMGSMVWQEFEDPEVNVQGGFWII